MQKVVIIIPTYNEAANLPATIEQLAKVIVQLKNYQVEVLIVDDSSPDGTATVVKKLQKS